MISVQSAMLVALGFLAASLLGLLVASAFWARAVRLTSARIKQSMPLSEQEIMADRDRLRAEYAIRVHKLEMQLDQAKLERARHLIEINRRDASISTLETDMGQLRVGLEENQNARRVLEQTVADRLPRVEARLAEAKRLLFNRDREIAELTAGARRHKQQLEEASSLNAQQSAKIERLTTAITTRGNGRRGRGATGDAHVDGELALRAEIEVLRDKTKEQAALIDRLQRRLGNGYGLPAITKAPNGAAPETAAESRPDASGEGPREAIARAQQSIDEAEAAMGPARAGAAAEAVEMRAGYEREMRALRARIDDQSGEIARLKSALEAFEQYDGKVGGLKDSKIGLKARLGSAQAQADQQAATIKKLRAELAASHERLARQAAHFMDEMRRIGGRSTVPTTGPTTSQGALVARAMRGTERRGVADRVAQVRAVPPPGERTGEPTGGPRIRGEAAAQKPAESVGPDIAAAQLPKGPEIREERRRMRLLDRLTGIGKS